jgi:acetyl-CoA acyltransferase 1
VYLFVFWARIVGITSENVAAQFGISREQQDALAVASHARAAQAQASGAFSREIVPTEAVVKDKSSGEVTGTVTVAADDGVRPDTTAASLAKLKPAFAPEGSTTAGNSSQVSDGAAAVVLASRAAASAAGLRPLAVLRASSVRPPGKNLSCWIDPLNYRLD